MPTNLFGDELESTGPAESQEDRRRRMNRERQQLWRNRHGFSRAAMDHNTEQQAND